MENKIVNYFMGEFKGLNKYSEIKLKEMEYLLKCLYSVITKLTVIYILNFMLGTAKELTLLLIFYFPLRIYSFGFHTGGRWQCWITSTAVFTLLPFIIANISLSSLYMLYIIFPTIIITTLLSPADTKKRPIISKITRRKNKIKVLTISILLINVFVFSKSKVILSSLFIAYLWNLVCVTPILYFLFNQPYNNYKKYRKED